ncbi:MAG: hypothetical protein SGJ18_13105 [Pseudomonadota bacterium]|nr:hypothetical protein [Pseudomonadota bacterium]
MKKLVMLMALGLACTASASEVVKEGTEAKVMYKGLDKVLGAVCADSRCLVMAGQVSCSNNLGETNEFVCNVASKNDVNQVYSVLGNPARSLFKSLVEFQAPVCQGNTCVSAVLSMECTSYGYMFPDYLCRAVVSE